MLNSLNYRYGQRLNWYISVITGCFFWTIFTFTNVAAQTVLNDQSPIINRAGSILITHADGWQVSPDKPEYITDGFNLKEGVPILSFHLDTLQSVLGEQKYGWAELAFEADSTLSNRAWLVRNIGYAAIRVWLNGTPVFNDGEPSLLKSDEKPGTLKPLSYAPVAIRSGINYMLIEFSYHNVPDWLYTIRAYPRSYVMPVFSDPQNFANVQKAEQNRVFIFGAVSFVLFLLSLSNLYLSIKSVNKYYYYAFWTCVFLLLHAITQMGDTAFGWSFAMLPVRQLGHVILFLFVFYNIIFTIGTYYRLPLPKKSLLVFFGMYLALSVYAVLFWYDVIMILHPILAISNLAFAVYLLRQARRENLGLRVFLMFFGFMVMLLGTFIYAIIYQLFFVESDFIYYISTIMVYMAVPVSFTITIALDFVDIFEKMEQKVIERTKELKEKDEFKSRFFLNVSHELRTPTTILEGLLLKAAEQHDHNSHIRIPKEDSTLILRNAKRLAELVNQILDLSKSDKGALSLQKKHYRLDDLIQNVIELNQSFVALRHQTIAFTSKTPLTIASLDGEKFSTILSNVLINASKYGPEHSRIRIETRVNEMTNMIEIDIKDEGEGVAISDRDVIFERFHRIKTPDKPYVEGLGIGLELSRSLARLHDGDLVVAEDDEKGARFRLTLPYDKGMALHPVNGWDTSARHQVERIMHVNAEVVSPDRVRLLLVEDNPDMNAYVKGILSELGSVHSCKNGVEALVWLQKNAVDIVVTDLMMPEMTGEALIQRMASDPKLSVIPIVVLSAKDNVDERLNLLRVGIIDYITKPFIASELKLKIENLMRFYKRRKSYMVELPEEGIPEEASLSERVKNYILEHIDDTHLTTSVLADAFAMSERNFFRKIEKDSGMTPAAFIREVRLQYAARLVERSSHIRLNELASKIGYKSVETFKRNYIERFGVSPN
jgi:signal transduction histidine kinase/DNA-binding response OmpR family regulator